MTNPTMTNPIPNPPDANHLAPARSVPTRSAPPAPAPLPTNSAPPKTASPAASPATTAPSPPLACIISGSRASSTRPSTTSAKSKPSAPSANAAISRKPPNSSNSVNTKGFLTTPPSMGSFFQCTRSKPSPNAWRVSNESRHMEHVRFHTQPPRVRTSSSPPRTRGPPTPLAPALRRIRTRHPHRDPAHQGDHRHRLASQPQPFARSRPARPRRQPTHRAS